MTITTISDREIALQAQLAAATQLAQLNGEIAAELKADKLALEAAIEVSRKQEPVGYVPALGFNMVKEEGGWARLEGNPSSLHVLPVYAAPVVAPDVLKDAERYRWLREQSWRNNLCVVDSPKNSLKLGAFCPSQERLDSLIDAAIGGAND